MFASNCRAISAGGRYPRDAASGGVALDVKNGPGLQPCRNDVIWIMQNTPLSLFLSLSYCLHCAGIRSVKVEAIHFGKFIERH